MNYLKRIVELLLHPKRLFWAVAFRLTANRSFNGVTMRLPPPAQKKFLPFVNTRYETEECEALYLLGKPGWSFLDIGANIGVITVMMSRIAGPSGKVMAYEPNPLAYSLLEDALQLNHCENSECVNKLVSDKNSTECIHISDVGGLGVRSSMIAKDPGSRELMLPAVTIDSIVALEGDVDYIKVDTEGAEYMIVSGAEHTLEMVRPLVQIEVHGQYLRQAGISVEHLVRLFEQKKYICMNIVTWSVFRLEDYMTCTHCHAPDTFTGKDMAYEGYGQLVFVPLEKQHMLKNIVPRACPFCAAKGSR